MVPAVLSPTRTAPRRPFTSLWQCESDIALMTSMLEDLRALLAGARCGAVEIVPYQRIAKQVHGFGRRVIVCRPERLEELKQQYVVGFFSQRRPGADQKVLERANLGVVREFPNHPSILSYSSWELSAGNWANFIVGSDPDTAARWRECEAHAKSVAELASAHYRNVRIHSGRLPGGVGGPRSMVIERSKYWDYESPALWRAVREYPAAAAG